LRQFVEVRAKKRGELHEVAPKKEAEKLTFTYFSAFTTAIFGIFGIEKG